MRRPHYFRLDSFNDDEPFVWTNGEIIEHGTALYRDGHYVVVRLHRGRGMVVEEWLGSTRVHKAGDPSYDDAA